MTNDLYDFEKDHQEHVELPAILKKGGPEQVREAFQAMVGIFRTQDVEYLVSSEGKRSSATPAKPHKAVQVRQAKCPRASCWPRPCAQTPFSTRKLPRL